MKSALVFMHEEDEASRGNPPSKFHDLSEILRLTDPLLFCKLERSFYRGPHPHVSAEWIPTPPSGIQDSDGQLFPSLHTPPFQDISTAPGTHPLQESVCPFASEIAGLVCPFHRIPLY